MCLEVHFLAGAKEWARELKMEERKPVVRVWGVLFLGFLFFLFFFFGLFENSVSCGDQRAFFGTFFVVSKVQC